MNVDHDIKGSDLPAELPLFSTITVTDIVAQVEQLLDDNRRQVARLLAQEVLKEGAASIWEHLLQPLEVLADRLHQQWAPIAHLHAVADNPPLRVAYNECLPRLSAYHSELGQNRQLYEYCQTLATDKTQWQRLDAAQRKVVENILLDFRLSGVHLEKDQRDRFRTLQQELVALSARFEQNVLDATEAWELVITDAEQLAGIPALACEQAQRSAAQHGHKNAWRFGLDFPSRMAILRHADRRELRHKMYQASQTIASDQGEHAGRWDNSEVMCDILQRRTELARLLDYPSYAHYALARRMAKEPQEVLDFLHTLAARSLPAAQAEFAELRDFARDQCAIDEIQAWDVAWCAERLRRQRFHLSQEELRPFFALPVVLEGMFAVVQRLYGVHITARKAVDVWHPEVSFYDIHDRTGSLRGSFYLDPYAREGKRSGAWMDECICRRRTATGTVQTPVAWLVCNLTPATENRPALLDHDEVLTLFHEFGHGLHHMLTQVDHIEISGINGVPWDAVELPSQFMENWCWQREALDLFARHIDTDAGLGDDLFQRLQQSRSFQGGMQMMRQLEFALFDFRLHLEYPDRENMDIQALLDSVRQDTAVFLPPEWVRFQHAFSHIFAGGYAAGYYSYKWAEVLSADAFSRFEECGVFDAKSGRDFMENILERGGSEEPLVLFQRFRGRPPSTDALLRHAGIAAEG